MIISEICLSNKFKTKRGPFKIKVNFGLIVILHLLFDKQPSPQQPYNQLSFS